MNKLTLIREAWEKARASRLIQPTPILSQLVEQEIGSEFQSHFNPISCVILSDLLDMSESQFY